MVSSGNITFCAYRHRPDLDPKCNFGGRPPKGSLNPYHLCTFATGNHKNAPSQNAYFRNSILSFLGITFRTTSPESIWSSVSKQNITFSLILVKCMNFVFLDLNFFLENCIEFCMFSKKGRPSYFPPL